MLVTGRSRASFLVFAILVFGTLSAFSLFMPEATWNPVIGIDLGTTYSCVAVYRYGMFEIIANDQGNRITPSWVAFTDDEILIGEAAKNQADVNAERTIFDVKNLMGRKFEDTEVQRQRKIVPYNIVSKDEQPYIQVKIGGETRVFSPEDISAMILTKMKETAEAYLRTEIRDAVITVPAYFNDAQRQATKDAGVIAGLNVARISNEPIAAAIAYGLDKKDGEKNILFFDMKGGKNILVFDLGAGTLNVSILTIDNAVFEVLATNGDTRLGGNSFDQRIMEHFIKLIKKKHGKDISKDNRALGELRRNTERARRALIRQHQVSVEIKSLFDGIDFSEPLTRAEFEELNNDLLRKTMGPVKKAMEDAGLEKDQIDEIVVVGGSTGIPKVQQLLKEYFDGKEPKMGVNPDVAVAYGAAVQGDIISAQRGIETEGILSEEEFDSMVRQVEEFVEEDNRVKKKIDARNRLETFIYNMKNQINEKDKLAGKLESEEKEKIETAVKEALEWLVKLESEEKEKIDTAVKEALEWLVELESEEKEKIDTPDKEDLESLVDNQSAMKEDYDEKHKEVEAVCNPIITAVYQRSGGASGADAEDKDEHSHNKL